MLAAICPNGMMMNTDVASGLVIHAGSMVATLDVPL